MTTTSTPAIKIPNHYEKSSQFPSRKAHNLTCQDLLHMLWPIFPNDLRTCVDVGQISCHSRSMDDIIQPELGDEGALLQQQRQRLSNSAGSTTNSHFGITLSIPSKSVQRSKGKIDENLPQRESYVNGENLSTHLRCCGQIAGCLLEGNPRYTEQHLQLIFLTTSDREELENRDERSEKTRLKFLAHEEVLIRRPSNDNSTVALECGTRFSSGK